MDIHLQLTHQNRIYIKIINPFHNNRNWGYISHNGQISLKEEFWHILDDDFKNAYAWQQGAGMNGGVGYHCHSTNHTNLFRTLVLLSEYSERSENTENVVRFIFNI